MTPEHLELLRLKLRFMHLLNAVLWAVDAENFKGILEEALDWDESFVYAADQVAWTYGRRPPFRTRIFQLIHRSAERAKSMHEGWMRGAIIMWRLEGRLDAKEQDKPPKLLAQTRARRRGGRRRGSRR